MSAAISSREYFGCRLVVLAGFSRRPLPGRRLPAVEWAAAPFRRHSWGTRFQGCGRHSRHTRCIRLSRFEHRTIAAGGHDHRARSWDVVQGPAFSLFLYGSLESQFRFNIVRCARMSTAPCLGCADIPHVLDGESPFTTSTSWRLRASRRY